MGQVLVLELMSPDILYTNKQGIYKCSLELGAHFFKKNNFLPKNSSTNKTMLNCDKTSIWGMVAIIKLNEKTVL